MSSLEGEFGYTRAWFLSESGCARMLDGGQSFETASESVRQDCRNPEVEVRFDEQVDTGSQCVRFLWRTVQCRKCTSLLMSQ